MADNQPSQDQLDRRDKVQERYINLFVRTAERLENGEIDEETFGDRMRRIVKRYYIILALIASGGAFDPDNVEDRADMAVFLAYANSRIDDFLLDIRDGMSTSRISWRAGLYGLANHVFTRYSVPRLVWLNMEYLPGVDCLGNGACGCSLGWTEVEGGVEVEWFIDPMKENCSVCSEAASRSPYFFPYEDLKFLKQLLEEHMLVF